MTGQVLDSPVASLVLPVLMRPILSNLERQDMAASQTLRAALSKVTIKASLNSFHLINNIQVEHSHPGFTYDLVMRLVHKADLSVNMNEAVLRLQGGVSDQDSLEYRSSRTEEPFQELNRKSANLKRILSRIPDEITDRKTFLETIKEIASAIKKLLDAVNEVSAYIPGAQVIHKIFLIFRGHQIFNVTNRRANTLWSRERGSL